MKKPVSSSRTRVVYGSRDMTPLQLAKHLQSRCVRELPLYNDEDKNRGVRYAISKIGVRPFPYFNISEDRFENGRWFRTWTVEITVTPSLDVVLDDAFNALDRKTLQMIEETVLSCATRGPDR